MSTAKLKSCISKGLEDDLSYLELRVYLIEFKEEGGDQQEAINILEEIHQKQTNEEAADRLLELIDLTEGHGIKTLRVW